VVEQTYIGGLKVFENGTISQLNAGKLITPSTK
jgi:hypothetical protein